MGTGQDDNKLHHLTTTSSPPPLAREEEERSSSTLSEVSLSFLVNVDRKLCPEFLFPSFVSEPV
jgi:hypothetical protein